MHKVRNSTERSYFEERTLRILMSWSCLKKNFAISNYLISQKMLQQSCVKHMVTTVKKWRADGHLSPCFIADKPPMILQFLFPSFSSASRNL